MPIPEKKWKEMSEALDDFIHSPEGDAYFENIRKKKEIQQGRYARFEKYLETHDINELMQRLIAENGEERHDYCYKKGYEPYPNNKLNFLIHYVTDNLAPIEVAELNNKHFPNETWFFKGYYINMMWGQGVFTQLFDDKFNQIIAL
jgi:hypothetical protein